MFVLFIITTILLSILVATSCYFLWKFIKIVMIFEDDLSEAINSLNEVEDSIKNVLEMQMFFDSPEVKQAVQNVLEQVKMCRFSIQKVIQRFTERSKQQYITVWEETNPLNVPEELYEQVDLAPRLPGQPPGTPNPMEVIRREGIVLDVGRPRR